MSISLTLPDMTCGHCVKTVTATVQKVDPQATFKIDLANHRVVLESGHPAVEFEKALAEQGYPAR